MEKQKTAAMLAQKARKISGTRSLQLEEGYVLLLDGLKNVYVTTWRPYR